MKKVVLLLFIIFCYNFLFAQNNTSVKYVKGDSELCALCKKEVIYRDSILPKYYDKLMSKYKLNKLRKYKYEKTKDSLSLMLLAKNLQPASKVMYEKMKIYFKAIFNAKFDELNLSDMKTLSDCQLKADNMYKNMPFNLDNLEKEMEAVKKCYMNANFSQELKNIEDKWTTISIDNNQDLINLIKQQDDFIKDYESKLKDATLKINSINQIVNKIDKKCAFVKCDSTKNETKESTNDNILNNNKEPDCKCGCTYSSYDDCVKLIENLKNEIQKLKEQIDNNINYDIANNRPWMIDGEKTYFEAYKKSYVEEINCATLWQFYYSNNK